MYAQVTANEITTISGRLPNAARRLDSRAWVLGFPQASTELQQACGWFPVVDVARPADDSQAYDRSIELVDGRPTVVWTPRPWTPQEVESRRMADAPQLADVIAARLVAADNATPPPWKQPEGAHDAWLPGAIVTDATGDRWRNTLTVPNVWGLDVYGWENLDAVVPVGPQPWKQPEGGHDAYSIGDRVTFEGATYESSIDGNTWSPTAYPAGWTLIP